MQAHRKTILDVFLDFIKHLFSFRISPQIYIIFNVKSRCFLEDYKTLCFTVSIFQKCICNLLMSNLKKNILDIVLFLAADFENVFFSYVPV